MGQLLRCIFAILLLAAGIALCDGAAVAPREALGDSLSCGESLQGRSWDAGALMCSGSGSDCPGVTN